MGTGDISMGYVYMYVSIYIYLVQKYICVYVYRYLKMARLKSTAVLFLEILPTTQSFHQAYHMRITVALV